jgi:hypothetical protein
MDKPTVLSKLKEVRDDVRDYLDTGYEADAEISCVICGKIDGLIQEVERDSKR